MYVGLALCVADAHWPLQIQQPVGGVHALCGLICMHVNTVCVVIQTGLWSLMLLLSAFLGSYMGLLALPHGVTISRRVAPSQKMADMLLQDAFDCEGVQAAVFLRVSSDRGPLCIFSRCKSTVWPINYSILRWSLRSPRYSFTAWQVRHDKRHCCRPKSCIVQVRDNSA